VLGEAFGVGDPLQLGSALAARPPSDVAAAWPLVLAEVRAGDALARAVLQEGAAALAALAAAAARRAGLAPPLRVTTGGGVLEGSAELRAALADLVRSADPAAVVAAAEVSAAVGAARLARALARGETPLCGWLA
jgi:N-acetylglucosamine kinase-like BadF-type ATPase